METRLIIPAAGAGRRLGVALPKTLYHIGNKPILAHILDAVEGLVDEAIIVVSPSGKMSIVNYLASQNGIDIKVAVQTHPIGMADAVSIGLREFSHDSNFECIIIWGDQVTVRRDTIEKTINYHRATGAWLTFPTSIRNTPYTHVVRDAGGRVCGILESREGDMMPREGESDCGVFIAKGDVLNKGLNDLRHRLYDPFDSKFRRLNGSRSATGEFNFLPIVELWAAEGRRVEATIVATSEETLGINTPDEALLAESILKKTIVERNER